MPRRVYLLGVGLALVALAFVITDGVLWRAGLTERNVRQIRPGMTMRQVKVILGEPATIRLKGALVLKGYRDVGCWRGQSGEASVEFDKGERVARVSFARSAPATSPLARFRAWLGW
jgi:hypothetical protein